MKFTLNTLNTISTQPSLKPEFASAHSKSDDLSYNQRVQPSTLVKVKLNETILNYLKEKSFFLYLRKGMLTEDLNSLALRRAVKLKGCLLQYTLCSN